MVTYTPHWLVSMGGSLMTDNGPEIWSCNIRGNLTGAAPLEETFLTEIKTPLQTWFSTGTNKLSTLAWLNYVKCNHIGVDGKYTDPVTHRRDYTPHIGGAYSTTYPMTTTTAISFTTAVARGRAHTGRVYLPLGLQGNNDVVQAGSVLLQTTYQDALIASGKALLSVLANSGGTVGLNPRVYSALDGSVNPITGVRVGSVLDSQRRRRDAYPETYRSAVWP